MRATNTVVMGVVIFMLVLFLPSIFIVDQGSQGIILQLGRLVKDSATGKTQVLRPGLHMKLPFIESVRLFDTRLQTLDIKSSRIVTKEKKDVIVDYYVKWRIQDFHIRSLNRKPHLYGGRFGISRRT